MGWLSRLFGGNSPLEVIRHYKGETKRQRDVVKWVHEELAKLDSYLREFEGREAYDDIDADIVAKADAENKRSALDDMVKQVMFARKEFGEDHPIPRAALQVVLDACRRGSLAVPKQLTE